MAERRAYRNVHGRRAGRGWRPWLLVPKLVFAAAFLGGLISVLVTGIFRAEPASHADWTREAAMVRSAYVLVIVPGLIGALLTGVLLALVHLPVFIRMRWLQVKLGLILVLVPAFHILMRSRSLALQEAVAQHDFTNAGMCREQLLWGTAGAVAFALCLVVLGRIKPRLGQDYARSFSRRA